MLGDGGMATILTPAPAGIDRERTFFLAMAIAIAVTAVGGFGFFILIGQSSFGAPWWVHVHALTMMGWVTLYLVQNLLVWQGNLALHRRLGMVGAAWSVWMVLVGFTVTALSLAAGRAPPFFDPVFFLAMDWLNIFAFAGLVWAGIRLRRRTDWHRRLMLGGTLVALGPAWGRLLPLPLLGETVVWWIAGVLLLYFAAGMIYDWRTRGRVHPAYRWGVGVMLAFVLLIRPLAGFPPFVALARSITG
ncbi:hypothetical membrane protein [Sphingobium sp. SYK-6]|nr:hypothetical membrane protein [Sphingobium sp. SYK-6]